MAYTDAITRLGPGGGPARQYAGDGLPTNVVSGVSEWTWASYQSQISADHPGLVTEQPSGGYGAANAYDAYKQRHQRRKKEQSRILEEIQEIKDDVDREIAEILQTQEQRDANEAELRQLVVDVAPDIGDMSARVARAYMKAANRGTFSSLLTLEKELERAIEEEEFLIIAMML